MKSNNTEASMARGNPQPRRRRSAGFQQMLANWDESSTWNSLSGGVATDDLEAVAMADSTLANPDLTGNVSFTNLEASLQAWSDGSTNYGWLLEIDNSNAWVFNTSESVNVPSLSIEWTSPPSITSNGGSDTAAVNVEENTTAVTDVDATDPDIGDTLNLQHRSY